jgi:hypothetical protein
MENSLEFPSYGIYEIDDSLELNLPNNAIQFKKITENVFSYMRKDSAGTITEKIIPSNKEKLKIEFAPIDALNYPAKRTNFMYLDFETTVFLSESSAAKIFVQCPIELGIFIITGAKKDSLDWFSCEPEKSRFGLYGSPDSGILCKYYKSHVVNSYDENEPFVNTVMQLNLENQLGSGHSITKVVFPINENKLYYKDNHCKYDSLNAVLKKKLTVEVLDVETNAIETDWTEAPPFEFSIPYKRIDMDVD